MGALENLLTKGLEVFDNIKLRDFQLDLSEAEARSNATLNAQQYTQNLNARGQFNFSSSQFAYAGLGIAGIIVIGYAVSRM